MLTPRIKQAFETALRLEKNAQTKRYQLLYEVIKDCIKVKELPEGERLPSSRKLAIDLKLSRSTVVKSYEMLLAEGFLEAKVGSGNTIINPLEASVRKMKPNLSPESYPELSKTGQSFLSNIHLINGTEDKSIAFRPGLPPLDIFPVNPWKNLTNLYWRQIRSSELSYAASSGMQVLKRNIAAYLNISRGIRCSSEQVFIVSGSLQSLFLLGSTLLNHGDGVVLENPTFPNVHSIFKSLGARLYPVELDDQGLSRKGLPNEMVKLLHLTPSCHYPLGKVMSVERRLELLNWAGEKRALIIENDYEHEINGFGKKALPAIFSLDVQDRTVYLGTFNRLLHPAVRIGYMVVPEAMIAPIEAFQKHSHRFVSPSLQLVFNQFIEKKLLFKHIKDVREVAQERYGIFTNELSKLFGKSLSIMPSEAFGLHVLAKLNASGSDNDWVECLREKQITAHAYSKCFIGNVKQNGLIFGYSSVRPPLMKTKLQQMKKALESGGYL